MTNTHRHIARKIEDGFTIVELMIATLVFSVILVVITSGVIHFTNSYYRGINSSTTQNTARAAIDTISQAIQFSAAGTTSVSETPLPSGGMQAFCAGNKQFIYMLGTLVKAGGLGIYTMPAPSGGGCNIPAAADIKGGTELLDPSMRLTALTVKQSATDNSIYTVSLRVAYGDNDLLCSPGIVNSCKPTTAALTDAQLRANDIQCKIQTGSQFCSVSALATAAQKRAGL